jgi:hypothetical protein
MKVKQKTDCIFRIAQIFIKTPVITFLPAGASKEHCHIEGEVLFSLSLLFIIR